MKKIALYLAAVAVTVFLAGCASSASSPASPSAEAEIANDKIVGSWYYAQGRGGALLQFTPSGKGTEVVIDQSQGFNVLYLPFEYTLTNKTIRQVTVISEFKAPNFKQYEMPSADRLRVINYIDNASPTFQKQNSLDVEGIWRRETDDGDIIDYIFAGGMLIKVQNGKPFAFGRTDMSGAVLILTEQARYVEYEDMKLWIASTVPPERCEYRLEGSTLSWTGTNGQLVFTRQ